MKTSPHFERTRVGGIPGQATLFASTALRLLGTAVAAALPSLPGQTAARSAAPAEEVVLLSEFTVNSTQDRGYRPGNSVSATRIDTPIKDLPFSVTAFTDAFIRDIGARDLNDIVRYAPSVTTAGKEFNLGDTFYTIRGFETAPTRNGFRVSNFGLYVDSATIERVEIPRGPATLLYGQLAPGGVVNYIAKRPKEKAATAIRTEMGSFNYGKVALDLNQPLAGGRLLTRVNLVAENSPEYVDGTNGEVYVVAPSVTWKVTEKSALTLDYQWYHRSDHPFALMRHNIRVPLATARLYPDPANSSRARFPVDYFGPFVLDDLRYNGADPNDYRKSDFESLFAEYAAQLGEHWNARVVFAYNTRRAESRRTGTGDATTNLPASIAATLSTDPAVYLQQITPLLNLARDGIISERRVLWELPKFWGRAWQAEVAGKFEFAHMSWRPLFGLTYDNSVTSEVRRQLPTNQWGTPWNLLDRSTWTANAVPVSALPVNFPLRYARFNNRGIYTIHQLNLLESRLHVVGGARWDRGVAEGTPEFETSRTTPQIGAGYKLRPDLMIYASYSESFQANNSLLRTKGVLTSTPAKPFIGTGYEAGLKLDLLEGRISATLAAFSIEQENYIFRLTEINPATGATETSDIQGSTVKSEGVELDLVFSPTDYWQVYLSLAYNDPRYARITAQDALYLLGQQPESTAKEMANLWTRYSFHGGALDGWWIGGGFNYTGSKQLISNNPFLYWPDRTIWNLTLGYDWKMRGADFSASLAWKNMTDEDDASAVRARGLGSRAILSLTTRF